MPKQVRLELRIYQDETLVKDFTRYAQPTVAGVLKVAGLVVAWLQTWTCQLSQAQWDHDVERATPPEPTPFVDDPDHVYTLENVDPIPDPSKIVYDARYPDHKDAATPRRATAPRPEVQR